MSVVLNKAPGGIVPGPFNVQKVPQQTCSGPFLPKRPPLRLEEGTFPRQKGREGILKGPLLQNP